jgi:serine/threonine-protein kinase
MLYHMLAGVSPLTETRDRMQRLSVNRYTDVKPINTLEPNLPHRVVMLVNKSIELNADRRFQSPGEMMAELKSIQKGLQQGTATSPDESGGTAATVTVAEEAPKLEGDSRTLMLVESNTKVLEALRERLKGLGYRVLVTIDPERALKRFEDDPALAHCVIFSTGDLGRSALDAFNQFASYSATANVPAILLVDQRQKQILENAKLGPTRVAVAMPLQFKQLRSVLLKLLAA